MGAQFCDQTGHLNSPISIHLLSIFSPTLPSLQSLPLSHLYLLTNSSPTLPSYSLIILPYSPIAPVLKKLHDRSSKWWRNIYILSVGLRYELYKHIPIKMYTLSVSLRYELYTHISIKI